MRIVKVRDNLLIRYLDWIDRRLYRLILRLKYVMEEEST